MDKTIRIYTDGACSGNPGPGGWATVWCDGDKLKDHRGGEPNTTNNKMELLAVLEALRWICKQRKSKSVSYEIYSDSAYVVNAITKCWLENARMEDKFWRSSEEQGSVAASRSNTFNNPDAVPSIVPQSKRPCW